MTNTELYNEVYKDDITIADKLKRAERTAFALDNVRLKISNARKLARNDTQWGQGLISAFDVCLMIINDEMENIK